MKRLTGVFQHVPKPGEAIEIRIDNGEVTDFKIAPVLSEGNAKAEAPTPQPAHEPKYKEGDLVYVKVRGIVVDDYRPTGGGAPRVMVHIPAMTENFDGDTVNAGYDSLIPRPDSDPSYE